MEIPFKGRHRKEDYMLLARIDFYIGTNRVRTNLFDPDKFSILVGSLFLLPLMLSVIGGLGIPEFGDIVFFGALGGGSFVGGLIRFRRKMLIWDTGIQWNKDYHGVITEKEIFRKSALIESRYSWQTIKNYYLTHDVMLLFDNISLAYIFPRHFFASDADWQSFLTLVGKKLPS